MDKFVRDVMSVDVKCCHKDTTISDVAHTMTANDVSAIVVTDDDGYLAGIISRTDLVALRGSDEYWYAVNAGHVMKSDVLTCAPDALIRDASKLLIQNKIHRLVVVESSNDHTALRPIGVLSQTDIVRDMATQRV